MGLRKFGEGEVIRDEEQQKTAAQAPEWTEKDQEELEDELSDDEADGEG